jgi:signal transduction histidine kinase/ABC-type amino acid transport substrate-binding protein
MKRFLAICIISLFTICSLKATSGDRWKDILENKGGKVVFYWYPNNIRIDQSKDIIDGVEHDLAMAFVQYLNDKYQINLGLDWIESESFDDVMNNVRNAENGIFGASSISITEERKQYLQFTPPFLPDVSVLVSNPSIPLAHTPKEFDEIFKDLTAITIHRTTLRKELLKLKRERKLNFDIEYVNNSGEIIERIDQLKNGFGYIDLPNFLVSFDKSNKVRRQFFYPIKLEGIAMIYPIDSDWDVPVEDYFGSEQFQIDKRRIIARYFGEDIMDVVDRIAKSAEIGPLEEIVISTREKELQYEELLAAATREKERIRINNALLIAFISAAFILLFLYINFQMKSRANVKLRQQQDTIANRNSQLQTLNQEKNDLIKILAHDLRSPISNISGCADLLKERKNLDEDSEKMIDFISQSSEKIESMISKILDVDAIDSGDHNLTIEEIDINNVVQTVVSENIDKAESKGITITAQLKSEKLKIKADHFYTSQIIENLLTNAIKFSKKNTEIKISAKRDDQGIQISVSDQGPGLTEEDKKRIFKKYQVLSATPTGGETSIGIGLSIVKRYTEIMGGGVSFESQVGKGTTFFIQLPVA